MANFNKVLLMGNLTRDPQLRYTSGENAVAVAEFGMAINRVRSGSDGSRQDKTTFVDVTVWRRTAEIVCEYLSKGSPVFVEGYLEYDAWTQDDGQKRSKLRVVATNVQFLGRRGTDDGAGTSRGAEGMQAPPEAAKQDNDTVPF